MYIRKATSDDAPAIWAMLEPMIRDGETYALARDLSRGDALAYWLGPDKTTFVAEEGGVLLGTYFIKANQAGGGSHVCNCGYVTSEMARGRGVASRMCVHSLEVARKAGYRAMQYNLVVSSNEGAIRLWKRHGFDIAGTLPGAFHHPGRGDIDAHVMYQKL